MFSRPVMIISRIFLTIALLLLLRSPGRAQDEPYYFYRGLDFGSEALVNPLSLTINGGFGILQYGNLSRDVSKIRYGTGFHNVFANLSHPGGSISEYGWGDFFANEIFPVSFSKKNAQYWPNYQNHLIGGGMNYVQMKEWYRYHGYPGPGISAIVTMAVYHVLNEAVENNAYRGTNVDPIADLLIFDPLGIALFSLAGVPEFFSRTLNLADWSLQPTFNPAHGTVENQGINYSIKYRLPFQERVSLFYYWGLTGLVGLSYATDTSRNISVGAGLRAKELVATDDAGERRKLTVTLTWNVGVFYDRENSLLWSLIISGVSDYRAHLNIYPGLVSIGGFRPGFFWALSEHGVMTAGISASFSPVGLAHRFTR